MKFLLYCFEWLSGLNINYHKSEVVTFGVDNETKVRIANMMNCQIGSLPIKYFGFPISDKRLACGAFKSIIDKMRNTLQPWRGGGGEIILTNSYFWSMPNYMMSMFQLYGEVHQQMDAIRSKFFWGSDGGKCTT
jgi:hypothetical protein